jgi:tRNA (cmo5U34)-methyltransferase
MREAQVPERAAMSQPPEAFDPARYFDQSVADRYDQGIRLSCPGYDALHQMVAPWLALLPGDCSFLSAGAGTGAEIIALARRFPSWRFVGVDVSAQMLQVCRHRIAEADIRNPVTLFNGRLEDYRAPAPFDAASSIFVVHFIKGRELKLAYFRAIAANLKPGGLFVLADLFGDQRSADFVRLLRAWLISYMSQGISGENLAQDIAHIFKNIAFMPESDLPALLREAGFIDPLRFYQAFLFGGWVAVKA